LIEAVLSGIGGGMGIYDTVMGFFVSVPEALRFLMWRDRMDVPSQCMIVRTVE
jgi:hypothetical protein